MIIQCIYRIFEVCAFILILLCKDAYYVGIGRQPMLLVIAFSSQEVLSTACILIVITFWIDGIQTAFIHMTVIFPDAWWLHSQKELKFNISIHVYYTQTVKSPLASQSIL